MRGKPYVGERRGAYDSSFVLSLSTFGGLPSKQVGSHLLRSSVPVFVFGPCSIPHTPVETCHFCLESKTSSQLSGAATKSVQPFVEPSLVAFGRGLNPVTLV